MVVVPDVVWLLLLLLFVSTQGAHIHLLRSVIPAAALQLMLLLLGSTEGAYMALTVAVAKGMTTQHSRPVATHAHLP